MKLSERSIRKYIRKLIMETFYAGPQGDVMDKEQMAKQDPTFFDPDRTAKTGYGDHTFFPGAPPPNEPGSEVESFIFDKRLAALAKQDLEDPNPVFVSKLGNLFGDSNILNKLTFTEEDLSILPDIDDENETSVKQGLELMYAIGDGLYDYLNHIYDLKDTGFGDYMRRQRRSFRPDNLTQRGVGQETVLTDAHPLKMLFSPVQEGQVGMGRSLILGRVDRIITSALANLNNMTPIEFRDTVYPAVESVVRQAFARMPHVQKNLSYYPEINDALEAYLEAIHYVLAEVIGEINFEYTYDGDDNTQMIFIPSDPQVRKALDVYGRRHGSGYYPKEAIKSKVASAFSENQTYGASPEDKVILRDIPDYYNMKFSVNPQEASVLKEKSSNIFDWRLKVNLGFGVGLRELGVDDDLGYDAMHVYDEG